MRVVGILIPSKVLQNNYMVEVEKMIPENGI